MQIDQAQVERLARAVRISLSDEEKAAYIDQLNQTMDLIESIKGIDTKGVQATITTSQASNITRPDEVLAGADREVLQATAKLVEDGYYKVPVIIE